MNTTPERPKEEKEVGGVRLTRLAQMRVDRKDQKFNPDYPPVAAAEYILEYLFDIGPAVGGDPVTHSEVRAWQENTGIDLHPWEVSMVRRLSREYVAMAFDAMRHDCKSPWFVETDLDVTARKLMLAVRNLATL